MAETAALTLTALEGLPTIAAGADLAALIAAAASRSGIGLRSGDVLVVAQKIVSKAEGRRVSLAAVTPSPRARELAPVVDKDPRLVELILQESAEVLRARPGVIIVVHRLGFVLANAGIDASNVESEAGDEAVLLLPADPDRSAEALRRRLAVLTGAELGIVINDSFGRAWRLGTVGTAIGVAGLPALIDLRGTPDRTGRALRVTEIGAADELAAAASLLMGQAGEGRPVIHVRGFPYPPRQGKAGELLRPAALDLFR
ncbi:MAG TPA: coenzyme F420-0:L-glutamate ligase [Stellaceae bacterium]|jgi:coenzyme F420-0:L-glutamate ligase/coenzyme F420-1:gamma-L-glutamate ligase|nr:coenzyme F420-0:L-glutamate ligase [Stellaceae bacterium]